MNLELKGAFGDDSRATDYGDKYVLPPCINRQKKPLGEQRNFPSRTIRSHNELKSNIDDPMAISAWAFAGEMG